jgi:predicted nucleic acid-binding protein
MVSGAGRIPDVALIADSGGLFALYDARDPFHREVRKVVTAERGPIIIPMAILAEIDYLLTSRLGIEAELRFLEGIEQGSFTLEPLLPEDATRCKELVSRYRDLSLGLADASIIATAERLGVDRILTVDERIFGRCGRRRGVRLFCCLQIGRSRAPQALTSKVSLAIAFVLGILGPIVPRMNKTLYIRDEDAATWDRAKKLAGDRLSPVIVEALKRFVAEKEIQQNGFQRIVVEFNDSLNNGLPKAKAFFGRWIIDRDEPLRLPCEDPDGRLDHVVSVAQTAKGSVAVYSFFERPGEKWNEQFVVYTSFEKAAADDYVKDAVLEAVRRRGVPVEELDI